MVSTGLVSNTCSVRALLKSGLVLRDTQPLSSSLNVVTSAKTLQPVVGGWPGPPTCRGLSRHPWASPDKARSSLRPALSMTRAAMAVNSTWMIPTMTEARLLS